MSTSPGCSIDPLRAAGAVKAVGWSRPVVRFDFQHVGQIIDANAQSATGAMPRSSCANNSCSDSAPVGMVTGVVHSPRASPIHLTCQRFARSTTSRKHRRRTRKLTDVQSVLAQIAAAVGTLPHFDHVRAVLRWPRCGRGNPAAAMPQSSQRANSNRFASRIATKGSKNVPLPGGMPSRTPSSSTDDPLALSWPGTTK